MNQEIFHNAQVDLSVLPTAAEVSWKGLEPGYRTLLILSTVFSGAVMIGLISIAVPFTGLPLWVPAVATGAVIMFMSIQLLAIFKGFASKGYVVRTHDILYRSGWLFRRELAIPLKRVQHVDIRQGVYERVFGLFRINIYTAGGDSSDLSIPGLRETDAQRLKAYILDQKPWLDEEE